MDKSSAKAEFGGIAFILGLLALWVSASIGPTVLYAIPAVDASGTRTTNCELTQVLELHNKRSSVWKCADGSIVFLQSPHAKTAPDLTIEFK